MPKADAVLKQYRFRDVQGKIALNTALLVVAAFAFHGAVIAAQQGRLFSAAIFVLVLFEAVFLCFRFEWFFPGIIIDSRGIWPRVGGGRRFPGRAWQDLPLIGLIRPNAQLIVLVLASKYGDSWTLPLTDSNGKPLYEPVGHTHALIDAIEMYHGPVRELSSAEQAKIKKLRWHQDLGEAAKRATVFAFCIGLLAFLSIGLLLAPMGFVLLDTDSSAKLLAFGIGGGIAFVGAMGYVWRSTPWFAALLIALINAAAVLFLLFALWPMAMAGMGQERQETFIAAERGKIQYWTSGQTPGLGFPIRARPDERLFPEDGARQTLTIRCAAFQQCVIAESELRKLYEKKKKARTGERS
jgi:hypothetical protein